ncbi:MAG: tRNA dihydrouridine synthase DusB, partial [Verrucomicrobiota bacterium]
MIEFYGEDRGCIQFRKVAPWYAKRFGPAKYFKDRVVRFSSREEFDTILADYIEWRERFCGDDGELLPQYALGEQHSSITHGVLNEKIKVPKGPVEKW